MKNFSALNIEPDKREAIALELGDCLFYLAVMASDLGYSLSTIADMNIAKLQDRKDRHDAKWVWRLSVRLVADIETDNFLHKLTKIHCIAAINADNPSQTWVFGPEEIDDGVALLQSADELIFPQRDHVRYTSNPETLPRLQYGQSDTD